MPKKKKCTPEEFTTAARKEFDYLRTDFGFEEDEDRRKYLSPRSICFSSPLTTVTVEGFPITTSVQVTLTCLAPDGEEPIRVPLSALITERLPAAMEAAQDLLGELAREAGLLRQHAADLLRGEANARAEAQRLAERLARSQSLSKGAGVS